MRETQTKFHLQGIRNPVFRIRNSLRGIQNPRLSWITFFIIHGVISRLFSFRNKKK